ncbi:hypothetical protein HLH32_02675 [Gluconacetobacter liquefaciens]|uniref:Spy/CpxP family protein refolding chaperone n=2 Tax=Gluconacetobacter liquefaciens TaxID=89584 RepID=A0A7W4JIC2_GLULI|nr:hypothetical protein [Gluconacetobacter liquefaciens]
MRMKPVWLLSLMLSLQASPAGARMIIADYPACDLKTQHALAGVVGAEITDQRQAHIAERANILQADIGNARKARYLSQGLANRMWRQVDAVRTDADALQRRQGFLSAAERASYDRQLDSIAGRLCR